MNIKPRLYADANIKLGPAYFDYDNYEFGVGYLITLIFYKIIREL